MRGMSRLGVLLSILFFLAAAYLSNQIIPFYYYYYELQGLMESQARNAGVISDAEIRKVLLKKIKELEIPVDNPEDALKINRYGGKINISLDYSEVLYFDLGEDRVYDLHVFHFKPQVEQRY
jgi:hypothetical protein